MQNIQDVYLFVNDLVNSNQSGQLSPDSFNTYIDIAQQEFVRRMLGLPEEYQWKLKDAKIEFQSSQIVNDALLPISTYIPLQLTGSGFTPPPNMILFGGADYIYTAMVDGQLVTKQWPITFVTWAEWLNTLQDSIEVPTPQYPIATYYNGQINIKPNVINQIGLYNVRYPVTPFRAYTIVSDQDVYDPSNSVQLEIPEFYWKSIAAICVEYISINLREGELLQATTKIQTTGQ